MTGALLFVTSAEIVERDGFFELTLTSGEVSTTYVMTPRSATGIVETWRVRLEAFRQRQSVTPFKGSGGRKRT